MASVSNRDSVVCATLPPTQEASLLWCRMPKRDRLRAAEEPGGTKIQQLPRCCGCRAASFSAAWALKGKVTCDCLECVAKEIGGKFTTRLLQWQWKSNLRVHSLTDVCCTWFHSHTWWCYISLHPVSISTSAALSGKLMTAASFCWELGVRVWMVLEHIPVISRQEAETHPRQVARPSHTPLTGTLMESNQANVRVLVGVIMFLDCGH